MITIIVITVFNNVLFGSFWKPLQQWHLALGIMDPFVHRLADAMPAVFLEERAFF